MVYMSSNPWVGWAWRPSPALTTRTGRYVLGDQGTVPDSLWRTTKISAAMVRRLFDGVEQGLALAVELRPMSSVNTSAEAFGSNIESGSASALFFKTG